jgi:hypothetical protein
MGLKQSLKNMQLYQTYRNQVDSEFEIGAKTNFGFCTKRFDHHLFGMWSDLDETLI